MKQHYTSTQLMYIPTTNLAPFEPFGGFMWPPRSYTCNFCRREFRSAQALGGHMNVHRRDRARLKQSSPPGRHLPVDSDEDFVDTELSMGMDSAGVCKRYKKSGRSDSTALAWAFVDDGSAAMEDVDLELRLGDAPAAIKKEFSVVF